MAASQENISSLSGAALKVEEDKKETKPPVGLDISIDGKTSTVDLQNTTQHALTEKIAALTDTANTLRNLQNGLFYQFNMMYRFQFLFGELSEEHKMARGRHMVKVEKLSMKIGAFERKIGALEKEAKEKLDPTPASSNSPLT
ncbi:MAG: hypothetical protein Q9203_007298 [Teloschistes exilis]